METLTLNNIALLPSLFQQKRANDPDPRSLRFSSPVLCPRVELSIAEL